MAAAQSAGRRLSHSGCPVEFTVPHEWEGKAGNACTYTFTNADKQVRLSLFSGSIGDGEEFYWNAADLDEHVADIKLGPYKAKHRLETNIYLASNAELLVLANSDSDDVSGVIEQLLSTMIFTGKSVHGSVRHPVLFDRACGVSTDYPSALIAKPGPQKCSVVLYTTWPPLASVPAIELKVNGSAYPDEYCIDHSDVYEPQVETVKNPNWILFKENGSGRGYGESGYQGLRDWEAWIFSDRCGKSLVVKDPTEDLEKFLIKTLKFSPASCEHPLTEPAVCNQ